MRVVSGRVDDPTVHYEAPGGRLVPGMMADWLRWVETPTPVDPLIRAAVGHLWFETIHPFDDGNGRVGRAAADLMLARAELAAGRYFSLSAQLRRDRQAYYEELETAQAGTLDATRWIAWFLGCLSRAARASNTVFDRVLRRAAFWKNPRALECNSRQRKALNRMLEGFEGEMKAHKYANLTRCSTDTASRDLAQLVELGLLRHNGKGGRSSGYLLPD
jgi:Fic family protein